MTLVNIGFAQGYTGRDHLLSDYILYDLIGETFESFRSLRRAADKIINQDGGREEKIAPVDYEVTIANQSETRCIRY